MQRSFQGPPNPAVGVLEDFGAREFAVMAPLGIGLIWLGIYPQAVLDVTAPVVAVILEIAHGAGA
jgi:NADH-quinone oxidoreductase subunit M